MRLGWFVALLCVACGGRVVAGADLGDATPEATLADAGPEAALADASMCALDGFHVLCGGTQHDQCDLGCKYHLEWKCGDQTFENNGGCGALDGSGTYQGWCAPINGYPTKYSLPTTTCACGDEDALASVFRGYCGQP